MPRPDRVLDATAGPVQALAAELRSLRERAGSPKYLQMARATGKSRTALAEAAGGDHLPTWETLAAFVAACGAKPSEWLVRWEKARDQVRAIREAAQSGGIEPDPPMANDLAQPPANGADARGDVLLVMWQEQRNQARQLENQRAILSVVAVTVALVTVFMPGGGLARGLALLAAGVLGAVACVKFYERHQMHMAGAESIRRRLDQLYPDLYIERDWRSSRAGHQRRYPLVYHVRLHHLWTALHASVGVIGVWLLATA